MQQRLTQRRTALLCALAGAGLSVLVGACAAPHRHDTLPLQTRQDLPPAPVSRARADLIRVTARQIGAPYRCGGNTRRGFDCSGLVQFVHRQVGIGIPRTAEEQWSQARIPRRRHLVPGDLLFFAIDGDKLRHVGIYEGGGVFIHAPSSGKQVSRASLDNPYWQRRMIGARTFL